MKKNLRFPAITLLLISTLLIASGTLLSPRISYSQGNNASYRTMTFKSDTKMQFWSGNKMKFGTNVTAQFIEVYPDGWLEPCDLLQIIWPPGYAPDPCSWWEIIDPSTGEPTGLEFHLDFYDPPYFWHVDLVWDPAGGGQPFPYPTDPIVARKKVDVIAPCEYYEVHWPSGWYPEPCTWWELLDPETGELTGVEFHVDWTNESCEFHIDEVLIYGDPGSYVLPFPWYEVWARQKIPDIKPCDYFVVEEPPDWYPEPCTWWEIIDFRSGEPTGYNFHVDWTNESCEFHIDEMDPGPYIFKPLPVPYVIAEKKITNITECDWFIVIDPLGFLPAPCSWWEILDDAGEPTGLEFHVDQTNGIDKFHVDGVKPGSVIEIPPSYTVTARTPLPWYMKLPYPDYAPSGMPDFDQRQNGTYTWVDYMGQWSHCGPVAVANSIWWLDSQFEPNTTPPPTVIDNYPLVQAYGGPPWDDHDPQNVPPLVEHLAWLMDTDGLRTLTPFKSGTNVFDMQAGITHYLSWSGVNPLGDVDGDGIVTALDAGIVASAFGTVPGAPGWDLRADIYPATMTYPPVTDNIIDTYDEILVAAHMGETGQFYEHTILAPWWEDIVEEVLMCQDVILLIAPWTYDAPTWYRYDEAAHFVTVAGLNASTLEIVLSDPILDNAEAGGYGDVPVPHVHIGEPPYITHNNASLVSHDAYHVIMDECPGGPLTIMDYPRAPQPYPLWKWQIEAAVITSPHAVHDVAVIDITHLKTIVTLDLCMFINATVENQGGFTETSINVTVKANNTVIQSKTVPSLAPGANTTLTFTWNASGFAKGNYTISATADPVLGETDTADNTLINGEVTVSCKGDITGPTPNVPDGTVNMRDISLVAKGFGANLVTDPASPKYGEYWHGAPCAQCPHSANCDLTGPPPGLPDWTINMRDVSLVAKLFGTGGC